MTAAAVLWAARRRSGLSQRELARRAGTVQSVISAYESGRRQPSVTSLRGLVEAAGCTFNLSIGDGRPLTTLTGRLGARLAVNRDEVIAIAARQGISNLRVFGSVARGDEKKTSDINLLVDTSPATTVEGIGQVRRQLRKLLGAYVDIVRSDRIKPFHARNIALEARPL